MPDSRPPNKRVIGLALVASAVLLCIIGALGYSGVLQLPDDVRVPVVVLLSVGALLDLLLAWWFLRSVS
jgi:hypothetical protein